MGVRPEYRHLVSLGGAAPFPLSHRWRWSVLKPDFLLWPDFCVTHKPLIGWHYS